MWKMPISSSLRALLCWRSRNIVYCHVGRNVAWNYVGAYVEWKWISSYVRSNRQHLNNDYWLEDKRKDYQNCSITGINSGYEGNAFLISGLKVCRYTPLLRTGTSEKSLRQYRHFCHRWKYAGTVRTGTGYYTNKSIMAALQLILRKGITIAATRCHILQLKCTKFDVGWGSPQTPLGELTSLSQTP